MSSPKALTIFFFGFRSRFKSLERRLSAVRDMLTAKIPEIEKTLESIRFLKAKKVRWIVWLAVVSLWLVAC